MVLDNFSSKGFATHLQVWLYRTLRVGECYQSIAYLQHIKNKAAKVSTEPTNNLQDPWTMPKGQKAQSPSHYGNGSSITSEDVGIRKTTDIQVTR